MTSYYHIATPEDMENYRQLKAASDNFQKAKVLAKADSNKSMLTTAQWNEYRLLCLAWATEYRNAGYRWSEDGKLEVADKH